MGEYLLPFIVVTLLAVIIIQAVERYFYASQMEKVKDKLIAAIMAKDITEYNAALKTEQEIQQPKLPENQEFDMSNISDDLFDKHIKEANAE